MSSTDEMWEAWHRFHYYCDTQRFQKIVARTELVKMIADVPGDIFDLGVYKGASALEFAHLLQVYQPHSRSKVVCFDTFKPAFPKARADERQSAEDHMTTYDKDAHQKLTSAVERLGLASRVKIVVGDVTETVPSYLADNPGSRIALLHCDLDVYEPTLATLKSAWPRIVPGGLLVFDEYAVENWGESDAVDEFLSGLPSPPRLQTLAVSATPTAYCVKP